MSVFGQLHAMTMTQSDMLLLIPMGLAGFVLSSGLPYRSRVVHYSLECGGTVLGLLIALLVVGALPHLF